MTVFFVSDDSQVDVIGVWKIPTSKPAGLPKRFAQLYKPLPKDKTIYNFGGISDFEAEITTAFGPSLGTKNVSINGVSLVGAVYFD